MALTVKACISWQNKTHLPNTVFTTRSQLHIASVDPTITPSLVAGSFQTLVVNATNMKLRPSCCKLFLVFQSSFSSYKTTSAYQHSTITSHINPQHSKIHQSTIDSIRNNTPCISALSPFWPYQPFSQVCLVGSIGQAHRTDAFL